MDDIVNIARKIDSVFDIRFKNAKVASFKNAFQGFLRPVHASYGRENFHIQAQQAVCAKKRPDKRAADQAGCAGNQDGFVFEKFRIPDALRRVFDILLKDPAAGAFHRHNHSPQI